MHCQLWCSFLNIAWLLAAGCGQIALLKVSNEGSLIFEDEDEDGCCEARIIFVELTSVPVVTPPPAAVSSLATL